MKEYIKDNFKWFISVVVIFLVTIILSIALGVTPNDVFSGLFKIEKASEQEEQKEIVEKENIESEVTFTYEDFLNNLPEFDGEHMFVSVNGNRPFFTDEDKANTEAFLSYSDLDEKRRVGVAIANICYDNFNSEPRQGDLSTVTPSGWNQVDTLAKFNINLKYNDDITHYLYARSHLIGYAMGGEELDPRGIFTGTVSCNLTMLHFENAILNFLDNAKKDHVLYRVTPVYKEADDVIPYGILMEAYSVESKGLFIDYCNFIFNAEPGFVIDYKTGDVSLAQN